MFLFRQTIVGTIKSIFINIDSLYLAAVVLKFSRINSMSVKLRDTRVARGRKNPRVKRFSFAELLTREQANCALYRMTRVCVCVCSCARAVTLAHAAYLRSVECANERETVATAPLRNPCRRHLRFYDTLEKKLRCFVRESICASLRYCQIYIIDS